MKAAILKILQLQEEGVINQEQAAELLAALADQAREKDGAAGTGSAPSEGAPGPRGDSPPGPAACGTGGGFNATATLHDMVDAAIGVGATVGRAATVLGGELVHMVHRDEGGNTVTLSKVDGPSGDAYTFRGNTFNVSKVSHMVFNQAQVTDNAVNASKVAHLLITRGRFSQCTVAGSSISHVTIEGTATDALAPQVGAGEAGARWVPPTGLQAVTFNATKFSRVSLAGGSVVESTTFQAAAVKQWSLTEGAAIRNSKFNDSSISEVTLQQASLQNVTVERSALQVVSLRGVTLENTVISATRGHSITLAGGAWKGVRIGRQMGGKESWLEEARFENCTLTDCEFTGCTFRRTTLRGVTLAGKTVRNVDFTGMVIESEEAFRQAAGV